MEKIAIVGPGAVGGVMAVRLMNTGRHDVVLCARQPLSELVVDGEGGTLRTTPVVLTDPAAARPVDWVLVTTKAYDVPGAARWLPGLCTSGTKVAVLQNGVEHRERFIPYLPAEQIVPVMVDCPAERSTPTHIRQRGEAKMVVADDEAGRAFVALFADTVVNVTLTPDFKSVVWRKLCTNAAGAISALVLRPSEVMQDAQIGETALGIVRECLAVARAEGAVLADGVAEDVLRAYRAAPPDSVNSLHADRAAGRPMETDARNGVIVRLGRRHGIPTPLNQMIVALLGVMR